MKLILRHIRQYFYEVDKRILAWVTLLAALLIFLNYYYYVDDRISDRHSFVYSLLSRYGIFLLAFALPYFLYQVFKQKSYFRNPAFVLLLLWAPLVFSLKIALNIPIRFSNDPDWNDYWNHVFYWPVLVLIITFLLFITWRLADRDQPFYGLTIKNLKWKPYLLMLLFMVPLVAAASTQQDFLAMYPKLKIISGIYNAADLDWWHKLLFELSYGSDFFSIELFFRGFVILAFIKWAGKDAILPMACFYCTIHFGKPLGECISSYFGGLILGIVISHTRSIFGGLMVHLGIAWMMELGGFIGNGFVNG